MKDWGQFFNAVLPSDGEADYCLNRNRNRDQFVSLDKLTKYVNDGAGNDENTSQFFAVAQYFKGAHSRATINATAKRSFVLDIDVRPTEPNSYPDKQAAIMALFRLVTSGALKEPSYILDSGGGYHVYWATTRDMPIKEFKDRASAFAAKLKSLDGRLARDTGPTANAVTLLRLPNSYNNKYDPPHKVGLANFGGLTVSSGTAYDPDDIAPMSSGAAAQAVASGAPRSMQGSAPMLSSAADLYAGCAVLRYARDKMSEPYGSPDYVGYPLWRMGLKLLSFTADGAQEAHRFSAPGPSYDPAKTDYQFAAARREMQTHPPITCATLCAEVPGGRNLCVGCPFYNATKGSPYTAAKHEEAYRVAALQGSSVAPAPKPTPVGLRPTALPSVDLAAAPAAGANTPQPVTYPSLPKDDDQFVKAAKMLANGLDGSILLPLSAIGLALPPELVSGGGDISIDMQHGGMVAHIQGKNAFDHSAIPVTKAVFWPLRMVQRPDAGAAGGSRSDIQVAVAKLIDGAWWGKITTVKYERWSGGEGDLLTELAGLGVFVNRVKAATATLFNWTQNKSAELNEKHKLVSYDHFGWNGPKAGGRKEFIIGTYRFDAGNVAPADLNAELRTLSDQFFNLKGSVDGAREALKFIWDHGSDAYKFILLLAAGTPTLRFTSAAGAYINLYGPSGLGKSLMGTTITGLWGNGASNAAHISTKDTANARYARIAALHSLPVVHDEATVLHRNPDEIGNYLYEVSEGKGKARADRAGDARAAKTWNTLVVATSNNRIRDTLTIGSAEIEAQVARAYEIHIDRPAMNGLSDADVSLMAQAAGQAIDASSGVPGLMLAEYYTRNFDQVAAATAAVNQYYRQNTVASAGEQRTRQAVLSVAVSGAQALKDSGLLALDLRTEALPLIDRVDGAVQSGNTTAVLNLSAAVGALMLDLQANTAYVCHDPSVPAEVRASTGEGLGVKLEPVLDLRARVDYVPGVKEAYVTIHKEAVIQRLDRLGIRFDYFAKRMSDAGHTLSVGMYSLANGLTMRARDSRSITAIAPPAECVMLKFSVTPGVEDRTSNPPKSTLPKLLNMQ